MAWTVEILDETVAAELAALPADMRARFLWISRLIADKGFPQVSLPHVRHLDGRLYEMRMSGRDGIARAIYVTARGERVIVVRVFVKKTQKTPASELKLAGERAKEVK